MNTNTRDLLWRTLSFRKVYPLNLSELAILTEWETDGLLFRDPVGAYHRMGS